MNQHRRWMPGAIVIGSVLIVLVGLAGYAGLSPIDIRDAEIQQSGEGFQVGEFMVAATFGYSDDGDRLRYAIIRTWPVATPPSERVADTRVSWGPGILPLVRHADGVMRPVETDGRLYFFFDHELRTMRVSMNEHTNTIGLHRAGDLEGIWKHFQQFRVAEKAPE